MPLFTLHRNYILRTTKGHSIGFRKDEPVWVPPECVPDAVAIGAAPVDADVDVLGDEDTPVVHLTPEQRQQKLFDAFKTLTARNERGDFTGSNLPHTGKLTELCGFEVTRRERDTAWQAFASAEAEA